ncbi:MAG: GNAT family N-acetyltransferase [Phycisphaerales bacterium]
MSVNKVLTPPEPWCMPDPLPDRRETARLVLRYWRDEDAPGLFEAVSRSREYLKPWLPWAPKEHLTIAQTIYSIENMRRERESEDPRRDNVVLAIVDRATGEPVGGTGLHRIVHAAHEAEIGYWIRQSRARQGLCTEAVRALISWAFTPRQAGGWALRRVHIRCCSLNVASRGVPTKIGLRQELHLHRDRWVDRHGWADTLGWGVIADEWDCQRECLRGATL